MPLALLQVRSRLGHCMTRRNTRVLILGAVLEYYFVIAVISECLLCAMRLTIQAALVSSSQV